jgi:hypothetical protein
MYIDVICRKSMEFHGSQLEDGDLPLAQDKSVASRIGGLASQARAIIFHVHQAAAIATAQPGPQPGLPQLI